MWFKTSWIVLIAVNIAFLRVADASDCRTLLQDFFEFNRQQPDANSDNGLLYVLQTPGTHEKYLFDCLLRIGTKGSKRCPTFREQLKDDTISKLPQCKVLSSFDDLSVLQGLPEHTSVAAQLRDPVDRLVSAYQLSVEVAAQKLKHAGAGRNPLEQARLTHPADHYPWSQLSEFLVKNMKKKEKELDEEPEAENWVQLEDTDGSTYYMNTQTEEEKDDLTEDERTQLLPAADPYDNKLVMPLKEFIKHPKVFQLLHNGELFQVLGLTNVSRWSGAQELRKCIRKDAAVAEAALKFAMERLEKFVHVGVADDLHHSLEVAAATLGLPLDGAAYAPGEVFVPGLKKLRTMSWKGGMKPGNGDSTPQEVELPHHGATTVEELEEMIVKQEAEAQRLYDIAYDMFMEGKKHDNAKVAEARDKVSAARTALMHMKYDLEELKKQKDLDKTLDNNLAAEHRVCVNFFEEAVANRTKKTMQQFVLPDGRMVKFTPEARQAIPSEVLAEIRSLNALDVKLHEFAKQLLQKKRQELKAAGKLPAFPASISTSSEAAKQPPRTEEL